MAKPSLANPMSGPCCPDDLMCIRMWTLVQGTRSDRCRVATTQERDSRGVDCVTLARPFDVNITEMHTDLLALRGATVEVFWRVIGRGIGIPRKLGPDGEKDTGTSPSGSRLFANSSLKQIMSLKKTLLSLSRHAVVFPAASRTAVRCQTHSSSCDIKAMPLALSEMGTKAPMVKHTVRLPNMLHAPTANKDTRT